MAANEEVLEELYELLTLYFETLSATGPIKPFDACTAIEPQLDRVIFKEILFARISDTITRLIN